jgi:hypothetical protein
MSTYKHNPKFCQDENTKHFPSLKIDTTKTTQTGMPHLKTIDKMLHTHCPVYRQLRLTKKSSYYL